MKNLVIGVIVSSLVFIGLGWLLVGRQTPEKIFDLAITSQDHQTNASASATLVEYSDFQCPACGAYSELVSQLKKDLGAKVNIVYRHFPLRQIHKNAQLAGQAAEAASSQGKFWEMHDILFENQIDWAELENPAAKFEEYATSLNLNIEKFRTDSESQAAKAKIDADYASGLRFTVNATPTFYLNGVKMTNPATYETFKGLVESKLQ